jgi:hypothetical protein
MEERQEEQQSKKARIACDQSGPMCACVAVSIHGQRIHHASCSQSPQQQQRLANIAAAREAAARSAQRRIFRAAPSSAAALATYQAMTTAGISESDEREEDKENQAPLPCRNAALGCSKTFPSLKGKRTHESHCIRPMQASHIQPAGHAHSLSASKRSRDGAEADESAVASAAAGDDIDFGESGFGVGGDDDFFLPQPDLPLACQRPTQLPAVSDFRSQDKQTILDRALASLQQQHQQHQQRQQHLHQLDDVVADADGPFDVMWDDIRPDWTRGSDRPQPAPICTWLADMVVSEGLSRRETQRILDMAKTFKADGAEHLPDTARQFFNNINKYLPLDHAAFAAKMETIECDGVEYDVPVFDAVRSLGILLSQADVVRDAQWQFAPEWDQGERVFPSFAASERMEGESISPPICCLCGLYMEWGGERIVSHSAFVQTCDWHQIRGGI